MSYDKNNIFAKIIRREIPAKLVYEDDHVVAINDIAPAAPVHVLVMPKGEYSSFDDFITDAPTELVTHFFTVAGKLARELKLDASGYRLIANHGADASQSVAHFHMHILGGKAMGGLLPGDTSARE